MCKCPIQRQHRTLKNALYLGGTHRSVQLSENIYEGILVWFSFYLFFSVYIRNNQSKRKTGKISTSLLMWMFSFPVCSPPFFFFFSFGHFTFQIILLVASVIIFLVWGSSCVCFFFFFKTKQVCRDGIFIFCCLCNQMWTILTVVIR